MSKTSSAPVTARSGYLKKYLSSPGTKEHNEKRKRRKEKNDQPSGKGSYGQAFRLRLIEEDAFLPIPTANCKQQSSDDEDCDGIVGYDSCGGGTAKKGTVGPSFKLDSFVVVSGTASNATQRKARRRRDSGTDISDSPATRRRRPVTTADDDGDLSPVRRPANRKAPESPDASPPRRRTTREDHSSSPDTSPPRRPSQRPSKEIKLEVESESEELRAGSSGAVTKAPKGDGGRKAGLVTMKEMREETLRLQAEEEQKMKQLGDEISGRNAETRRREGGFRHKRDSKEIEERKRREAEKQAELDKKYKTWNKGVAQLQQREQKLQEMEQTIKEGFARYADDKAMNEHLKGQLKDEDPMADYIKTKRHKVQMKEGLVYPTYKGHWPPNRFAIPPGYRWDGVNRSNGFEGKLATAENKRLAQEEVTYKSIMECED